MIDCMVAPCPWNSHANLLAVRVKNAASVRVELVFLKESVGGFRGVKVDSREVIVFEVLPRPGKSLAGDFCHVTARGLAMDDSRLQRVSMRRVESLVSEGIHVSDSARRSAPEAVDTKGDIPVDVVF